MSSIQRPTTESQCYLVLLSYVRISYLSHNAALRGECRLNQIPADHFHHKNQPHTKNATRHESLLNALLCLRLKGLSFTIPRA
uniref:Uncharacterized protein n=1 Tax=Vibrio vulnificus TaxID=672 RepID=A0A6S4Q0B9_VIBVL|nr:hypothetical protein [Vibrio vulnificus]